jgi:hypothetical protein
MGSKFIINRRSSLDLHFILQAWTRIAQRKTRKYLFMVLAFQMKIFMVIAFQIKVLKLHTEDGSPPAPASSSSPYAAATVPPPPYAAFTAPCGCASFAAVCNTPCL